MPSYDQVIHEKLFSQNVFSEWERITTRVSQGPILGPLLFNIFLNNLIFFVSSYSHADDNTLYTLGDNLKKFKNDLRNSFDMVNHWLYVNYMVLHAGKCHFMCLGNNTKVKLVNIHWLKGCLSGLPNPSFSDQMSLQILTKSIN